MKEILDRGNKIYVDRGEIARMIKIFNCSRQTVHNALRGATEGDLTNMIRAEALKSGGVERPKRVKVLRVEV
jgi:hypothetical protein